jgi:hypothetical protein
MERPMGWWSDVSRGAAFEFGARHYRAFGVLHAVRWLARPLAWLLATLVVLGALSAFAWLVLWPAADRVSWPAVLRFAALAVALAVAAHFVWERTGNRAAARRAFSGREFSPFTIAGAALAVAMVAASFFL